MKKKNELILKNQSTRVEIIAKLIFLSNEMLHLFWIFGVLLLDEDFDDMDDEEAYVGDE